MQWLQKAAGKEYPYAWLELGDFYLYDYDNRREQEKAYAYYEKAAREDCVNEGLGLCLERGIGVEINEEEAFKYYLKAAEDGYIRAMYYTGLAYYYATGVKENYQEAFRWFNDAAMQEHIPSIYYKAKMLLAGMMYACLMLEGLGKANESIAVTLSLPTEFALFRPDHTYSLNELKEYFRKEASVLA